MKQQDALYSEYLIDGIEMDATPAQLLRSYCEADLPEAPCPGRIADESVDPTPTPCTYRQSGTASYIEEISKMEERIPLGYARAASRNAVAGSIIDTLWSNGHFRLENVAISPRWDWSNEKVGSMAAFYDSVDAVGELASDMGLKVGKVSFNEADSCRLTVDTAIMASAEDEEDGGEVAVVPGRKCPAEAVNDSSSWIIYVPFDTCSYRLGGSAFSAVAGNGGDRASDIADPDYFIDCYEVMRELVEDGIVLSGASVGRGGLVSAAARLCRNTGMTLDISGISSSLMEDKSERILFAEVPGVLFQIDDSDFDYIDSQFLLQDVAYYPVGHPKGESGVINIRNSRKPVVSGILDALLSQTSEGED